MPDTPITPLPLTDRREFLRCGACSLAALAIMACGGGDATSPAPGGTPGGTTGGTNGGTTGGTGGTGATDTRYEVSGSQVKFFLSKISELSAVPSFFLADGIATIVLRTGTSEYSAFTAVCTHEGCLVSSFNGSQMVCPCHGSVYSTSGGVISGPATGALAQFGTSFDAVNNELLVSKTG